MIRSVQRRARQFAACLLLASPAVAAAQAAPPSPEEVLGYSLGEHFTDYAGVQRYARELAAASPRVEYLPYGVTPERRELFRLVVASPEHHQRLDAILAANAELTRAGVSEARAREIAASNPGVVYLSYGVHGNESSSSEAGMWTAWDLARGAPEVAGVLDSLVVVMEPVVNPDGRDRYVQWYRSVAGATPDPDPQTREHREPWPGGRYNHYLFDLNRDWAWMTQPETRRGSPTGTRWNPQVHVDFHEMGPNSTYFFFPASAPINPIYPQSIMDWWSRFGNANARAFDAQGWAYFTRENYDMLYPGYGDSWPSLMGTIGMTYEQAGGGSAGLAYERSAGDTLTLHDRATHHRTTGHATLRTSAAGKSRLLLDFASAHRTAGEGHPDILLLPGDDPRRVESLVGHLRAQGIQVEWTDDAFRASATPYPGYGERRDFPAVTYRVRADQPRGRLAVTLLQPETELVAEHSYDITAWSLPYAYGVEAHQVDPGLGGDWRPWTGGVDDGALADPNVGYGYLVRPGSSSAGPILRFLAAGGRVSVLSRASTFAGEAWPAGTWFLPAGRNPELHAMARAAGLDGHVTAVATGLSEEGIDLGSANTRPVSAPKIGLVGGEGVTPTSYGAHWYFLEQMVGTEFDALLAADLDRIDLAEYDVLILPDARGSALSEAARQAVQGWVEGGGRLVAVAGGAEVGARIAGVELREEALPDTSEGPDRFLATRRERERREWETEVPGSILPVALDPGHPLAWGAAAEGTDGGLFVLHEGTRVFEPAEGAEAVAVFAEDLEATSGVISGAQLERLERGVWLLRKELGSGSVVLFADDPLFRLFWRSMHPLYTNAILVGDL